MIRILDHKDAAGLITRKAVRLEEAERIVAPILDDVRKRGDAALLEYARKFDGFAGDSVRMPVDGSLTRQMQSAVETAAANIREHARTQMPVERFIE
jgi:histidinol dehydrogenase